VNFITCHSSEIFLKHLIFKEYDSATVTNGFINSMTLHAYKYCYDILSVSSNTKNKDEVIDIKKLSLQISTPFTVYN
jgi:hypothetical protein